MLDIRFVRENPEVVKENIKNKFQDSKLPLVDEVIDLDKRNREIKQEVEGLRAERNKISKMIGGLMKEGKREEAEEAKKKVTANAQRVESLSAEEKEVEEKIKKIVQMALEEVNEDADEVIEYGENTALFGKGEGMDSFSFVTFTSRVLSSSLFSGLYAFSSRKAS